MNRAVRLQPVLALLVLVLILPMMLIVAGLVVCSLGRPVLFRQMRSGKGGTPFRMVKFRTMRELRDEAGDLLPDALRTTGVGRFLRRSRLDELPELVNVIAGDMNLVGPRPLLPETIAEMGEGGVLRGSVRPGLTGLAQVSGNTLLGRDEKLALDTWYVRNRSWWLDWRIVLRTVAVVIAGERRVGL
ncbi:MAG: sugar transferase [Sphingomonas sp.]|uniref:sugar transferase n=1 Tax=Sphingomonas sp. TaxID=28214 RepID=UPI002276A38A|nr:sugar transferase [Sphingomonas sp.]MCX8474755.1 sugar transferase [Sphingomonas sp.]